MADMALENRLIGTDRLPTIIFHGQCELLAILMKVNSDEMSGNEFVAPPKKNRGPSLKNASKWGKTSQHHNSAHTV